MLSSNPSVSKGARFATLTVVILPLIGVISAIFLTWGWGVSWVEISILATLYMLTILGITVGFHRLFTHRSFEAHPALQSVLAILGSMAIQGPLLKWVALHRRHHQHSDQPDDPHSPHHSGTGIAGVLRGAWHAHIGWFFDPDPQDLHRYTKDLAKDRMLRTISALFPVWVLLSLAVPAILGGWITDSWKGALLGFIWGGLVRIFLVHHVTWSINSICHIWGKRQFATKDQSRNNLLFGILGLGEGWHNNHHAFPVSARHGLQWWQIDISYYLIYLFSKLRLAHNVRLPRSLYAPPVTS